MLNNINSLLVKINNKMKKLLKKYNKNKIYIYKYFEV